MHPPRIPENEAQRMSALRATGALFTPSDERFDRVTRIASHLLGTPIALITLVADTLQWFKSAQNLDVPETSRDISFCGHAILGEDTLVVGNAAKDPRFADNPLVTGAPFIKAYAGHPLHATDGSRIGTLCVIDHKPRKFSGKQIRLLRDLAAIAETELQRNELERSNHCFGQEIEEIKRKEAIDPLTRLWNQAAVIKLLESELARATRGIPTSLAIARADFPRNANVVNDKVTVNLLRMELASRIRRAVRASDLIGYCGGQEYIIVFSRCELDTAREICERMRSFVDYENIVTPSGLVKVTISIGLAGHDAQRHSALLLVAAADAALLRSEALGGNRVEIDGAIGGISAQPLLGAKSPG